VTVAAGTARACVIALSIVAAGCINGPAVLTQQVEARRLASDLRVQFTKAADASNRAVMADTDDASAAAAREAEESRKQVGQRLDSLRPILKSLGYSDEVSALEAFEGRYAEYRTLDDEILPLAVENTNLKAQRLSFGPAREAVDAFRSALRSTAGAARAQKPCCPDALIAKGVEALLEIQVLQARHIAESDEAAMTRMEAEMKSLAGEARRSLEALKGQAAAPLADAAAALARFVSTNDEIVTLSRRNSNVRSLALTLGRKRVVTAACDEQLRILEEALGRHAFAATR
jgi:hypothetical protein